MLTTNETAFIDEIIAHGGVLCETWETPDPDDEDAIILHVLVPVPDDADVAAAVAGEAS